MSMAGLPYIPGHPLHTSLCSAVRMFVLKLTVFCLLVCGSLAFRGFRGFRGRPQHHQWDGHWHGPMNSNPPADEDECNPPDTLLGRFCQSLLDNDRDENGYTDNSDIYTDFATYESDGNPNNLTEAEVVDHITCNLNYSEEYARFLFSNFDRDGNGAVEPTVDFADPIRLDNIPFLTLQYTRLDAYCNDTANRVSPMDIELCAQNDALDLANVTIFSCRPQLCPQPQRRPYYWHP